MDDPPHRRASTIIAGVALNRPPWTQRRTETVTTSNRRFNDFLQPDDLQGCLT
jgi:hypothetical protein